MTHLKLIIVKKTSQFKTPSKNDCGWETGDQDVMVNSVESSREVE